MAERFRSHNKLQEWGLKGAALITLGTLALTACGNEKADAGHAPDRPAASASATPGSSESSTTPSETASSSPETTKSFEMGETVLANSTVYNELSKSDQTEVEKNSQLSFMQFEKLSPEERAMVALVLSDAHADKFLEGVEGVILPGNYKTNKDGMREKASLGDMRVPSSSYIPESEKAKSTDGKVTVAQDLYYWTLNSTPEDVVASNNGQPYFTVQFERAIAAAMASTGNPQLLEDAKKIMGGSNYRGTEEVVGGGPAYDAYGGHLTERINDLRTMSETKTDTLEYLGYPNANPDRHHFANAVGGPFDGYPANVTLGFATYNPDTQQMEDGVNNDGSGAAAYQVIVYKDKNGHPRSTWAESESTTSPDGSGIGVLEPNPTQ